MVLSLALVSVTGCSGAGEGDAGDAAEEEQKEYISRVWVIDTAWTHVLGRILEGDEEGVAVLGGSAQPFEEHGGNVWETNIDFLLDSGLLQEADGQYRVDPSLGMAEAGREISLGGEEIRDAVMRTLEASPVTWCGEETNGLDFADAYYTEHYGEFDSKKEYVVSIGKYVECGTAP
ncbi:hypothetical protein [Nocardiopsis sp. L17-MgMaSL7]|uniref:hypothetical protein n=1 Tax=Nocardiopsis sp. L17-MgMaSL7 TaxID=1938893 RepID=UPI000D712C2A|nr:hypothetical protein [Nocardiopsis sp. L17-MgMaSL7]PWV45513.1 hypothetical protein BDW27_11774 [Nocardiopsis sp. L17-MgMaSL7]